MRRELSCAADVTRIEVKRGLEGPASLGSCIETGAAGDDFSAPYVSYNRGVELDRAGILSSQYALATVNRYCAGHHHLSAVGAHAQDSVVLVPGALVTKRAGDRGRPVNGCIAGEELIEADEKELVGIGPGRGDGEGKAGDQGGNRQDAPSHARGL